MFKKSLSKLLYLYAYSIKLVKSIKRGGVKTLNSYKVM